MKWNKKIRCIVDFMFLGFLLAGCVKEKVVVTEPFHAEEICHLSQIEAQDGMNVGEVLAQAKWKEKIYMILDLSQEEERKWAFYQVQEDEVTQQFVLDAEEDDEICAFSVDSAGKYNIIKTVRYGRESYQIESD